jgi:hypothetical protein
MLTHPGFAVHPPWRQTNAGSSRRCINRDLRTKIHPHWAQQDLVAGSQLIRLDEPERLTIPCR